MTTPEKIDIEATVATAYARQRLADELMHRDDDRVQQRRQHALWCAAMTYAERGERVSGDAVLTRADSFLAWLDRP